VLNGSGGLPGSDGEHDAQEQWDSVDRARGFYDRQVLDHLNPAMQEFLARQQMMFVSTADARGECDSSFRAGEPGFVTVLDERTLVYPELRGNGVYASLGNIAENPHIGLLFIDFFTDLVGLHINGAAAVIEHEALLADERVTVRCWRCSLARRSSPGALGERDGARGLHPLFQAHPAAGPAGQAGRVGTDDMKRKGGDYFGVGATRAAGDPRSSNVEAT